MAVCCSGRYDFIMKLLVAILMPWLLIISCTYEAESQLTGNYRECPNTTEYNADSTYRANIQALLTNLSSERTRNDMFHDATEGGDGSSERVYGYFMCRGDVAINVCRDCVVRATSAISVLCANQKKANIWYDECILRYDNQSFFSTVDTSSGVYMINTGNESQSVLLSETLGKTMSNLTDRASSDDVSRNRGQMKGFATAENNFSASRTLYNLVQCSPYLSGFDCRRCLTMAANQLPACCTGRPGGRVLLPSCYVRYEFYPFYNILVAPPPSPTPGLSDPTGNGGTPIPLIVGIVLGVFFSLMMFILGSCFLRRRRRRARRRRNAYDSTIDGNEILIAESLQYDLVTIIDATNNFSSENKVGRGGFGDVFKGTLSDGQEIAVKRLSKTSGQGAQEFKNEVVLVAKLQHRNLVRLVGFCLEQEEKLLVYEFVPNKSLDYFLFDAEKQKLLDWSTRYQIIGGIAQGIVYLHVHSRLKIIHRDLKASNILLDGDMNPKISDFGMARLVGVDQTEANTNRIVGTFGYMAPEYAMHGEFSIKSDVFSFGVLLLEIIAGKRNNRLYQSPGGSRDLLSHAWNRWKDGIPLDLVDPTLGHSIVRNDVIRCIHIGLLCVQEDPEDRPTMTSVLLMLNNDSLPLPLPRVPAFFIHNRVDDTLKMVELENKAMQWSENEVSLSELYPR